MEHYKAIKEVFENKLMTWKNSHVLQLNEIKP